MRLLVLCTHNSARSQMMEGWIRFYAELAGLDAEVFSAGTEKTSVKPDAVTVMAEVGIDISGHTSKALDELLDPRDFDLVLTICDSANKACPVYPAKATRLHVSFPDPSGEPLDRWREVRDALGSTGRKMVEVLKRDATPTEQDLRPETLV